MTTAELITKEDLRAFEGELIEEIRGILHPVTGQSKQWVKSGKVRELLDISPGKLQTLRINGTISYTKMGGMLFYKLDDIYKVLEGAKR